METHTPGPWKIEELEKIQWGGEWALAVEVRSSETQTSIATVVIEAPFIDDVNDMDEGYANARLIAAAPTMLRALERYMAQADNCSPMEAVLLHNDMKKAIALAKRFCAE